MKQWFGELRTKWKMAKIESRIAMAETRLRMVVEKRSPHLALEIPLSEFQNSEVRTQATHRLKEIAETGGYQFSENSTHDMWLIEFRNSEIISELAKRQHEAVDSLLEHIREAASKEINTFSIQVLKIVADDGSFSKDRFLNSLAPTATELGYKVTQSVENEYWHIQFDK